jgi:hypothetical protein
MILPRMLRSAPRLRRGALLRRGPCFELEQMGPGSAEQREERCTAMRASHPKVLAQLQALGLVIGADALAVHGVGASQHFLVD